MGRAIQKSDELIGIANTVRSDTLAIFQRLNVIANSMANKQDVAELKALLQKVLDRTGAIDARVTTLSASIKDLSDVADMTLATVRAVSQGVAAVQEIATTARDTTVAVNGKSDHLLGLSSSIQADVQTLLRRLTTLASQSDIADLKAALVSLNDRVTAVQEIVTTSREITAGVDKKSERIIANTRLLQQGVDALLARLDEMSKSQATAERLALRQRIEENLADLGSTPVADFLLPQIQDGYLDAVPVGVRAVVTEVVSVMVATHQPMLPTAEAALRNGDKALREERFKEAYLWYRVAYQSSVLGVDVPPGLPAPMTLPKLQPGVE